MPNTFDILKCVIGSDRKTIRFILVIVVIGWMMASI